MRRLGGGMSKFISVCRERDLPGRSRTMTGLKRVDKSKGTCIIRSRSMFDKGQTRAYDDLFMYLFIYIILFMQKQHQGVLNTMALIAKL